MTTGDMELVREYAAHQSESAFTALLERHVNLVYSAALRQVRDPHLAEEITQSVFLILAQKAAALDARTILPGWLYRTTRFVSAATARRENRRRQREQQAHMEATSEAASANPHWEQVAPLLDEVMAQLGETDRDAIVLRYFQNLSLQAVGAALGIEERAAQKRVARALERLRHLFAKRGMPLSAAAVAGMISAHALQAAPAGLLLTISTAAAAGTVVPISTALLATKTIIMTTLQKAIVGVALAAAIGTGIYEARQAAHLRDQLKTTQQTQSEQLQQLQRERDDASASLTALRSENERLQTAAASLRNANAQNQVLSRSATPTPLPDNPPNPKPTGTTENDLPKDSWADVGFTTPQKALQTRGWAIVNGDRERFKDSVAITDGARKTLEDMFLKMAEASKDPNKAQLIQQVLADKLGVEEAILMPMMAQNQQLGYTGYHILSSQTASADETILEVETRMTSAPAKKETLKLKRFGTDWKVMIDEEFIKQGH